MDKAESEVAILILESTWLIADNVSAHARMDNAEFINSSCHSKLEMSPRQLLIHWQITGEFKMQMKLYYTILICDMNQNLIAMNKLHWTKMQDLSCTPKHFEIVQ